MNKQSVKILLLFLPFLLAACNFPLMRDSEADQLIATQVALAQTQTKEVPVEATKTMEVSSPTQETKPPTGTPTATPSPTPTEISFDPASQFGAPIWANPLNSGSAFGIDSSGYDDGYTQVEVSNGVMTLKSLTSTGWKGWRLTDRGISDFYLESDFILGSCNANDQFGIVVRAPDYASGSGYYFGINCVGSYYLWRSDGNGINVLIDKQLANPLEFNENTRINLGVLAKGDNIRLYINRELVDQINDSAFTSNTKFGVFITGKSAPGFWIKLDQMNLWNQ